MTTHAIKLILFSILLIFSAVRGVSQTKKTLNDNEFIKGDIIVLSGVRYSDSRITQETKDTLKQIASFLAAHSNLVVEIANYTDFRGSTEANEELSSLRATSARNYLTIVCRADGTMISCKGYGESNPIYTEAEISKVKNSAEKDRMHATNNRTEMHILEVR